MEMMIAVCGIKCNECPAFLATQENDDLKRKEVAEMWSKEFQASFKPEDINCNGCTSGQKRLFSHCQVCEIRKCGREKQLKNCAYCDDYSCSKLNELFGMIPQGKAVLDEIREDLSFGFSQALITSGPASDRAEKMMLYGQFIGSWDGTVVIHRPDGQRFENSCEVHFGWALAGRAIQDVWIAPARKTRAVGAEDGMYGTTLRVYDPKTDQWEITWIDPVRRNFNRMLGRPVGNKIIQEYRDETGNICQWCFTDIRPDSFHWISRESYDGRSTWNLTAEFFLHRRGEEEAAELE